MKRKSRSYKTKLGSLLLLLAFFLYYACYDGKAPLPDILDSPETTETALPAEFKAEVVRISDGDTFVVLFNGKKEKIRLLDIDCPENSQPFGREAKAFVNDLCYGETVRIVPNEKRDQYRRILAYVFTADSLNVNAALVKQGLAWNYKYSKNKEFKAYQKEAQALKRGLWSGDNPVNPWRWRKQHSGK